MFSQLIKEHQAQQATLRAENGIGLDCASIYCLERKKKIATQSVAVCTELMLDSVNQGVSRIFQNERRIETVCASVVV